MSITPPHQADRVLQASLSVEPDEWDAAVRNLGGCSFHSYTWSLFSAESNMAQPLYLNWRDARGKVIGAAVATVGKLQLAQLPVSRTLSLGSLPASSNELTTTDFIHDLISFARGKNFATLSLHSFGTPWGAEACVEAGFTISRRWEFVLDLSVGAEALWAGMHSKKRNLIRKGQKAGLRIQSTNSGNDTLLFRNIAADMYRRKLDRGIEFPTVGNQMYYQLLSRHLLGTGLGRLYLAWSGETPIAGAFFVGFNAKAYYLLSAASDQGLAMAAPDLLLWTAIQDYMTEGYSTFNFGGLSEKELNGNRLEESGLYHFKVRFGVRVMPCAHATLTLRPVLVRTVSSLRTLKHSIRSKFSKRSTT